MRSKKMVGLVLLSAAVLVTMALASLDVKENTKAPNKKRQARFYTGIQEAPVNVHFTLDAPHSTIKLPTVLQGDRVELTLAVPNPSDTPLELKSPKSCCGLIVTHVTPLIPPGEEGILKTVIITDKLGGKTLDGYVEVETTDPERPKLKLDATMEVTKLADISQHKIILSGPCSASLAGTATITPAGATPFAITGIKARKGLHIAYNVEKIKSKEGTRYLVRVQNTRKTAGVYRDILYLQTDHPDRPELRIRVEGHIEGDGS